MDTQELEAGDTLNLRTVDTDGGVCATFLPEVHNELFVISLNVSNVWYLNEPSKLQYIVNIIKYEQK